MIELSAQQVIKYAVPLIYKCMGDLVGAKAELEWESAQGDATDLWGMFDGDKLIAIAGLGSQLSRRKLWLGYLAVDPGYRHKGLGQAGLEWVEEIAASRGFREMFIETYGHPTFEAACKLYEKAGYKQVGELPEYLDDGSDALFYWKFLLDIAP